MSDGRVIKLWLEVAQVRMRQGKQAEAADDYAHVLAMQSVLHGEGAAALVPTCEALCKARVLLRQWAAAHEALARAHAISAARYGETDPRVTRIREVLGSLAQYVAPQGDEDGDEAERPLSAAH